MVRNRFERELDKLNNNLEEMGEMVSVAIQNAIKALTACNLEMAKEVIEGDDTINAMEKDIERQCMNLLMRQQPVASDLRLISTVLKMITDLERIGDQAADIAEITLHYCENTKIDATFETVSNMSGTSINMLKKALRAFRDGDLDLADEVIAMDDLVDEGFNHLRDIVIEEIRLSEEDPQNIIDVLMIGKYLERIGDHAQNVAEWVVFSITGQHELYKVGE